MLKPSTSIPKGLLRKLEGDAASPVAGSLRFILQLKSNSGIVDSSPASTFSKKIAARWPNVESEYKLLWRKSQGLIKNGEILETMTQSDTRVLSLICLDEKDKGTLLVNYAALKACLSKVGVLVSNEKGSVHVDHIEDEAIIKLIEEELIMRGINVTIYHKK